MRDLTLQYVAYLESIISANGLEYVGLKCFEKQSESCNVHIGSEHQINLERYSDDYGIQIENVAESRSIQQHIGHQPLVSTTELNVGGKRAEPLQNVVSKPSVVEKIVPSSQTVVCEVPEGIVMPRDNRDGRQCQLCSKVFTSRNRLFEHLRAEHGEMPRTGANNRQHRRRWKMRARKRAIASRGGSMDAKVDTVRAAQVRASGGDLQVVEESEKTCIVCNRDYTVGKDARRLPCGHAFHASCIDKWLRICRDRCFDPRCPICDAMVDRPE